MEYNQFVGSHKVHFKAVKGKVFDFKNLNPNITPVTALRADECVKFKKP
jgi:hypothetical protein